MALEQHSNAQLRFDQQASNARLDVLPFVAQTMRLTAGSRVLEIGTAEGGVLLPFAERGADCVGVDLDERRIELGRELHAAHRPAGSIELRCQNVYDAAFVAEFTHAFDLIILKDAIEHIPDQGRFIVHLRTLLRDGGQVFFGFPPWRMPFGGHQQICAGRLAMTPWYHLLPARAYRRVLERLGESPEVVGELMEIKQTGLSINRFEAIVAASGLRPVNTRHFLINPIYRDKFGLRPRTQFRVVQRIPHLRDFVTTCVYCTVA